MGWSIEDKVTKASVLKMLVAEGYLHTTETKEFIKPTHGSCCTCQTCGYPNDECVCEDNQLIEVVRNLE